MYRHQQEHLPPALMKTRDATEVVQADSLLAKITQLEMEARRLGKKAEDAGDFRGAMAAVRELVRIVELLAKMQGEITEPGGMTVNVVYFNPPGLGISKRAVPLAGSEELQEPGKSVMPAASSAIVDIKTICRK